MANASRLIGVLAACVVLMSASCVFAQDWPQWRGPNRDGKATAFTAPQTWPKTLTQKWKITVGTGDATPALVGERLYVFTRQGDDETLLCLDAAEGKEQWKNACAVQPLTGPAARHPGPRGSPAVAEGKVVTLGARGVLSCLDAADGKLAWRNDEFKAVPMFFTGMSPIVVDGTCIAHLGGKGAGAVAAFDLATGKLNWKWTGDAPAYASPVLLTVDGTKQLVVQAANNLVGLALADGKLLWQIATPTQFRFYNSATPIIDGQTVIYTGQGQGTKAVKIEKQGDGFAAKELWTNDKLGTGYNTPVLKDGLLFGLSDKGSLFCLNAGTGQTAWTDGATRKDNFGSVVDAGSVMLALPSNSPLIVYKPGGKQYEELARYPVGAGPIYAHPLVSGKRIYVKDQTSLTLWTVE
jgi:outer membrane protein assembly factor BamB